MATLNIMSYRVTNAGTYPFFILHKEQIGSIQVDGLPVEGSS